jgi:hypothetical protein
MPRFTPEDVLRRAVRTCDAGYDVRFDLAPDPGVDDSYVITLHGADTCWAVQAGNDGWYCINEYGHNANGELNSVTHRGMFRDPTRTAARLCSLLSPPRVGRAVVRSMLLLVAVLIGAALTARAQSMQPAPGLHSHDGGRTYHSHAN